MPSPCFLPRIPSAPPPFPLLPLPPFPPLCFLLGCHDFGADSCHSSFPALHSGSLFRWPYSPHPKQRMRLFAPPPGAIMTGKVCPPAAPPLPPAAFPLLGVPNPFAFQCDTNFDFNCIQDGSHSSEKFRKSQSSVSSSPVTGGGISKSPVVGFLTGNLASTSFRILTSCNNFSTTS